MPPHLLHVSDNALGGVAAFIERVAALQLAAGHAVTVAMPAGPVAERLAAAGARHLAWSAGPRPDHRLRREVATLGRVVAGARPDVVHLHNDKAGMVGRLLLRGRRPTVFQPHAWAFVAVQGPVGRATLSWERLAARWAHAIVCVGEEELRIARDAGIRAPLALARNGVDLDRWRPLDDEDRRAARARLGLDGAVPLAVCVGRLHRQKGQHRLLDAWPRVRARLPDAEVALVGDGPDRDALAARAVPGVRLAGATTDVAAWLAAADVVVQPSVWEGLSLSVLEALASARSLVLTDVPGMAEAVAAGGGALVPPDDRETLAAAVADRLADPELAAREGRAGRAAAEARFDLRAQVRALDGVYAGVLAAPSR